MSTKENIQKSINSRLKTTATRIEGGIVEDIVSSVSYELANIIDTRIDIILDNAFVTTADEEHLKIRGEELGIYQKEATFAFVEAKITQAEPNFLIEQGLIAKTQDGVSFQTIEDVITNGNGEATVKMQCLQSGAVGNIAPYTLNIIEDERVELISAKITNESSGYDGYETETTEEYRQRILDYLKDNAVNSNIADYEKWAKSVNGVSKVVVQDAFIEGPGLVCVYIASPFGQVVSDELIETVKKTIEKEQIINAKVIVKRLNHVEINIQADIYTKYDKDIDSIKAEFEQSIKEYLENAIGNVSYFYISNLLFATEGVSDVTNYLLNDSENSVILDKLDVAVLKEITLNQINEEL